MEASWDHLQNKPLTLKFLFQDKVCPKHYIYDVNRLNNLNSWVYNKMFNSLTKLRLFGLPSLPSHNDYLSWGSSHLFILVCPITSNRSLYFQYLYHLIYHSLTVKVILKGISGNAISLLLLFKTTVCAQFVFPDYMSVRSKGKGRFWGLADLGFVF